jgi:hypothetical protein
MPRISQTAKYAATTTLIDGIKKRLSAGKSYRVGGKTYSHEQLLASFQEQTQALEAIRSARIALAAAVARERLVARRAKAVRVALEQFLLNEFGPTSPVLAEFGVTAPKKPGPKTLQGKLAGAEKARATREARGTAGKARRRR